MKKIPLKRPYYIDKKRVRFRRPQDWLKNDGQKKYSMWPADEREILQSCDRYIAFIRDNPPHVTGWLLRGIDGERMLGIKLEIEERELARQQEYFRRCAEIRGSRSVGDTMR